MKLCLVDEKGEIVKQFSLPEEVLQSLADENGFQLVYKGWDVKRGFLGSTEEPYAVMRDKPGAKTAGYLNIALLEQVFCPDHWGFLPYMDRKERIEKGYTR